MPRTPQQYARPSSASAHVCACPALTDRTRTFSATRTGDSLDSVVPSPSCASELSPQQYTSPLLVTPHACDQPALMAEKVNLPPTGCGVRRVGRSPGTG